MVKEAHNGKGGTEKRLREDFKGHSHMCALMAEERMWMVRAGREANYIDEFKSKKIIAIGWNEVGDLSNAKNAEEIKQRVRDVYPESKEGKINITASQIIRFRFDFKKGDQVVSYDPNERIYLVGEISSDYIYTDKSNGYQHIRNVNWIGRVNRDEISTPTKNTLGAISTIFEISGDAKSEVSLLLKGKKEEIKHVEPTEEEVKDVIGNAREFIKDKVLALDWDEMQDLVAGLLRSMGYKTIVSAKGPDRGKDIRASPDGLGLEEPRIIVEVKHQSGPMGSGEISKLVGVLGKGDKGLYVSTGGFSKEAKYTADNSDKPITLIDHDMLVDLIIQNYDNFDFESRALIPLTKIYWPTGV